MLYIAKKRPDFRVLSFKKIAIKFIIIPNPVEDKKLVKRYFLDLVSLIMWKKSLNLILIFVLFVQFFESILIMISNARNEKIEEKRKK